MFNNLPLFEVNREERHFGFLFVAAFLNNKRYREKIRQEIAEIAGCEFSESELNVYLEPCLFRDYWYSLGDPVAYDEATHNKRRDILNLTLQAMGLDPSIIDSYDMFWTGAQNSKNSKLWFPGRWNQKHIERIQEDLQIPQNALYRIRWAFNAKPDILFTSNSSFIFCEIKLVSGFGYNENGYSQLQTQDDIIQIARNLFTENRTYSHFTITAKNDLGKNISWDRIIQLQRECSNNSFCDKMVETHFEKMIAFKK